MRTSALILFSLLLAGVDVSGKVGNLKLGQLVAASDLILVGHVESVITPLDGSRYATVRAVEVWKGGTLETVHVSLGTSFLCDVSDAKKGETVVLFLTQVQFGTYRIAHAGRGRWPIQMLDGTPHAVVDSQQIVPDEVPTQALKTPRGVFATLIELPTLRAFVRGNLADSCTVREEAAP